MAEGNFTGRIPSHLLCEYCGVRLTKKERYSFAQEKYICENPACPEKVQNEGNGMSEGRDATA